MEPPTDQELGEVAGEIVGQFFRAGILLGLQLHELDRLEVDGGRQGLNSWQINMQLFQRWREQTAAGSERNELKMLKILGKGRLAVKIDGSVREWQASSVFDPSVESLSAKELEEVSCEICDCWRRLAIRLDIDQTRVKHIQSRNEELSVKAFRCLWAWSEAGENVSKATLADALRKENKNRLASRIWPPECA